MAERILVSLGYHDRIEEIIPYVEKVARPGTKAVFLMQYPVGGYRAAKHEFGPEVAIEGLELLRHYSWEDNVRRAERTVSPAREVLGSKGIEVAVEVYAGSLKKAVRTYTLNGDVHWIMTRTTLGQRIAGFLNGSNSLFDLFRRPSIPPVLLIHPSTVA